MAYHHRTYGRCTGVILLATLLLVALSACQAGVALPTPTTSPATTVRSSLSPTTTPTAKPSPTVTLSPTPTSILPPVSPVSRKSIGPDGGHVIDLVIDPVTPTILYAAVHDGVYKSTNSGESWHEASIGLPPLAPGAPGIIALAVDPVTPTTLYAGVMFSGVYKSTSGGENWFPANAGLEGIQVHSLEINPVTPTILYVGGDEGVYKSTDGGQRWHEAHVGLPAAWITALAIDPLTPSTLYAQSCSNCMTGHSHSQLYKSVDGAE